MLNLEPLRKWTCDDQPISIECGLAELGRLVEDLSSKIGPGFWIFLNGDLGTGKTTFTQLFMKRFGFKESVSSPTFSIINVLHIPDPIFAIKKVCHLDLYRIRKQSELLHLGLELEFSGPTVCIFEWAEMIDVDGWSDFFRVTHCKKPNKIIEIKISNRKDCDERVYTICSIDVSSTLG